MLLARGADRAGAERLAESVRDAARSWGRSHAVTDWGADGILYGDADAVAEQAQRFAEVGVSELSVGIHGADDLAWFSERVIAPLKDALA